MPGSSGKEGNSMKLSAFFGQVNQNYVENTGIETTPAMEQGLKNGMNAILGKLPGQTISGEVLMKEGSDVLLSIGKNQLLQAKLEGNMSVLPGQLLAFQIKNNSGSKVVLAPLFENMGQDPNVSRALAAAGLPENSVTSQMVKAMMQEGLPIDKQSLYQMNRLISANPQADLQTLVQMQRLSLPVTPESIAQFEAYKSYQHQLTNSLTDITEAFTQTFQEITGNGNIQEGLTFYREVLGALLDGEAKAQEPSSDETGIGTGTKAEAEAKTGQVSQSQVSGKAMEGELVKPGVLPEEDLKEFAQQMKQVGVPDKVTAALLNNRISATELLGEIEKLLSEENAPDKGALFELLEGKGFKHLLKNHMTNQWLLNPEEVAKENSVEKLYERLNSQMNRLNQALSQAARADTPLARTVSNVSNNIDFMNQLNHMFTYVQIPLKMQGKNANGELFVYTNKKSLAKKDGSVSALLHLDMEHLGSVDVHVALNNQKVSTKFYLQDDSALDLIAQNISILNKRLEDRGYSMNAEFINKEENTTVMDEILKQGKNISALAGYSFDARA